MTEIRHVWTKGAAVEDHGDVHVHTGVALVVSAPTGSQDCPMCKDPDPALIERCLNRSRRALRRYKEPT